MSSEPTQDMLQRLSLEELESSGNQALREQRYQRAYLLFREAVQRAPFRHDLRDLLTIALEGRLDPPQEVSRRSGTSTLRVMRMPQPESEPEAPAAHETDRRPPRLRPLADPTRPAPFKIESTASKPIHHLNPGQYERRHRRGPLSALLLGAGVGMALMAVVGAAAWVYMQRHAQNGNGDAGAAAVSAQVQQEQTFEQVDRYLKVKNYSLAIEKLEKLPPSTPRDQRLADIHMDIGDQAFRREPAQMEAALDAYSKAVKYDPNSPEKGLALAQVYYSLARGEGGAGAENTTKYLPLARQTLQAVIDRNPQFLAAYDMMVKVAIALRDYNLQQQTYQKIIDTFPKDSDASRNARDSLRSLGYKYNF